MFPFAFFDLEHPQEPGFVTRPNFCVGIINDIPSTEESPFTDPEDPPS